MCSSDPLQPVCPCPCVLCAAPSPVGGGLSKFYRKARSFSSLTDVELGGGTTEQLAKRERQRAGSEEPEPRSEGDGGGGGGARAPGTFARWALGRAGSEGESPASVSGGGSAGSMPGTPSLLDRGCGAQSMPVGGSISMWDTGGDDDAVVSQVRRVSDGSSSDAAAAASRKATGMQRADTPVVGEFGKDAASPFFWAFSQPRRSMEMLAEEDEQE